MRKLPKKDLYRVYNRVTKRIYAKATTKERAERQLRLLRAIEYNPDFRPYAAADNTPGVRRTRRRKTKGDGDGDVVPASSSAAPESPPDKIGGDWGFYGMYI